MAEQDLRGDVEAGAVPAPEDELRPVTSLFADVVGSTGLGERLMPSEVKAVIGECVSRMCEVVEGYGGHVRSYMGDGIAAFFGIETTREDDPDRASRAALEIIRAIAGYASEVRSAWGVSDLNVRVGLNCGRVAVGQVGAGEPLVVALGDSVNVAARLQSAAQPGTIVVGASLATAISDRFVIRSLGRVSIRGRESDVDAFELVDEEAGTAQTFTAPFAGRDSEVDLISGMFSELMTGRGQVCLVVGEGGLGKTRLLAEARLRAPSDLIWLDGWCDPMDQRLPYEPYVQALKQWLGLGPRSSSIETRVRLKARGSDLLGERFEDCAPHLARLLGVELGARLDRRFEGMPGDVLTSSLVKAYVTWLVTLASRSPVVLALDNFGSITNAGSELALAILEALETAPILLLLALRPEAKAPGWEVRVRALANAAHRSAEVRLAPLRADECHGIVESLDVQNLLDDRLREVVVDRAEGNPLFLEELYAAVAADATGEAIEPTQLPGALESLLLSKIDALPSRAKSLLQAAAVLGRVFTKEVVALMCPITEVEDCLAILLRADVIRERGRDPARFVFRHGLVREAALSTLTPVRYREMNCLAAEALRASKHFNADRDAEALVGHYLASGDLEHAAECLERLGDRMALLGRFEEAVGLFRRCVAQFEPAHDRMNYLRLARKLAIHLIARGHLDEGMQCLDEAIAQADDTEESDLLLTKAEQYQRAGRVQEAEFAIAGYLSRAASTPRSLILQGKLALERQDLNGTLARLAEVGDPKDLDVNLGFEVASLHAGVLATQGDFGGAELLALKAQELADQSGVITQMLTARRHVALICLLKGCVGEAYGLTKYVYETYSDVGFVAGRLEAAVNLLHMAHLVGALDEALGIGEEVLPLAPSPAWAGVIVVNLAMIKWEQNCLDEAATLAEEALGLISGIDQWARTDAYVLLAEIHVASGDIASARVAVDAALAESDREGREGEQALVYAEMAQVQQCLGDRESARFWAEKARHALSQADAVTTMAIERFLIAVVGSSDGDSERAIRNLLPTIQRAGLRLEEGRALVALGSVDCDDAEQHFAQAERIFTECGCLRGLVELEEARRSVRPNAPTVS